MRFMLKVTMPVETGNALARKGTLGSTLNTILQDLKPEAVYFTEIGGQRTAFIVLDMTDTSQIPAIAEPFFIALQASVEFHAVMLPSDLEKAGPSIEAAAKKYG